MGVCRQKHTICHATNLKVPFSTQEKKMKFGRPYCSPRCLGEKGCFINIRKDEGSSEK